ncbi:hypothetical protein PIB30_112439, partial [Stylosanthes scabra]|nr:hypothetical protein [Stylosanthes scabra]
MAMRLLYLLKSGNLAQDCCSGPRDPRKQRTCSKKKERWRTLLCNLCDAPEILSEIRKSTSKCTGSYQ